MLLIIKWNFNETQNGKKLQPNTFLIVGHFILIMESQTRPQNNQNLPKTTNQKQDWLQKGLVIGWLIVEIWQSNTLTKLWKNLNKSIEILKFLVADTFKQGYQLTN